MTWAQRQAHTYPPDEGVRWRLLAMPVARPQRAQRARRRTRSTPLPGCPDCAGRDQGPCGRHATVDVMASLGAAPGGPRSPGEYVKREAVR